MRSRDAIYGEIMALARRRAKEALFRSDAPRRAAEEAHLRLIPGLLHCDDDRRHRHYLRVDRARFLRASRDKAGCSFQPLWEELERLLPPNGPHETGNDPPLARYAGPIQLDYGTGGGGDGGSLNG